MFYCSCFGSEVCLVHIVVLLFYIRIIIPNLQEAVDNQFRKQGKYEKGMPRYHQWKEVSNKQILLHSFTEKSARRFTKVLPISLDRRLGLYHFIRIPKFGLLGYNRKDIWRTPYARFEGKSFCHIICDFSITHVDWKTWISNSDEQVCFGSFVG